MHRIEIDGRGAYYLTGNETLGAHETASIVRYAPHREAPLNHPRLRRVVVPFPPTPGMRMLLALHWDDGTDLAALDRRIAAGATRDPVLDQALTCEVGWAACQACRTHRVLAQPARGMPGADADRFVGHVRSTTCAVCGDVRFASHVEDLTPRYVLPLRGNLATRLAYAVGALAFAGLVAVVAWQGGDWGGLPEGAARGIAVAIVMALIAFAVLEVARTRQAVLVDGSRIGRRSVLGREYAWTEEADIVAARFYRPVPRHGHAWLAVWAKGAGQRQHSQLAAMPLSSWALRLFRQHRRVYATQGVRPLIVPWAMLRASERQVVTEFLAAAGHDVSTAGRQR